MRFQRLTAKNAVQLAAPHTWPASVFPVLLGAVLSVALESSFSLLVFGLVLAASVLLQSSVNTINDYYDFVRGNDRQDDYVDPNDAVLVYNRINPKHVKMLGFFFMAEALLIGVYPVVYKGSALTAALGILGCIVIVAYSAGRLSISHLPLGEAISGVVMGALITAAVFSAFTGRVRWEVFLLSLPLVIGIGLIMMTNNTCDIERDIPTGRKTLPILLGRARAVRAYRALAGLWAVSIAALVALWFLKGAAFTGAVLLASVPVLRKLFMQKLEPQLRISCMGTIVKANMLLNSAYVIGIFASIQLK